MTKKYVVFSRCEDGTMFASEDGTWVDEVKQAAWFATKRSAQKHADILNGKDIDPLAIVRGEFNWSNWRSRADVREVAWHNR